MASFNDLNDDVLLIIIDILAEENLVRRSSQPRRNHLTAFSSTNRRLRFLATQVATKPLFHSVSLWGGRHLPGPGEKLLLGYRLSIPPTLARTRTLRVPHPYALELPLDNLERSHHEFARLLTAPARLERLDVHYPDMPVDDLLYPGINLGRFDLGGRKELNLPFSLDHVKTLSIHMISKALVPFCPNLEKIRIMTSAAGEDSWGSGEGRGFPGVLCDCAKLPRLVDFEMNRRIGPNVLELIHAALPNLERLALTGEGLAYLTISDRQVLHYPTTPPVPANPHPTQPPPSRQPRSTSLTQHHQQITARLSLFPLLHSLSLHHAFTPSSRPWGDSPDEPPDYRMACLLGGPAAHGSARPYFARHAVRFFEECGALRLLFFLPRSEFRLVRRMPGLAVEWVWEECGEGEPVGGNGNVEDTLEV
ncbi:hypothetical protein IWX47DRAFT_187877 [Phyllosticta citricarpa]